MPTLEMGAMILLVKRAIIRFVCMACSLAQLLHVVGAQNHSWLLPRGVGGLATAENLVLFYPEVELGKPSFQFQHMHSIYLSVGARLTNVQCTKQLGPDQATNPAAAVHRLEKRVSISICL